MQNRKIFVVEDNAPYLDQLKRTLVNDLDEEEPIGESLVERALDLIDDEELIDKIGLVIVDLELSGGDSSGPADFEGRDKILPKLRSQACWFDVVVDRENRQFVDILFDRPLGEGKVDQIIDPPPATIEPALGGSWKWKDTNALRFQPSGGFPVASEYRVDLISERLLKEGQVFSGETEVVIRTDQFLVEGVEVVEEPALEGKGKVVNPEVLAPRIWLEDPRASQAGGGHAGDVLAEPGHRVPDGGGAEGKGRADLKLRSCAHQSKGPPPPDLTPSVPLSHLPPIPRERGRRQVGHRGCSLALWARNMWKKEVADESDPCCG